MKDGVGLIVPFNKVLLDSISVAGLTIGDYDPKKINDKIVLVKTIIENDEKIIRMLKIMKA